LFKHKKGSRLLDILVSSIQH